jgi:hypothetical protein
VGQFEKAVVTPVCEACGASKCIRLDNENNQKDTLSDAAEGGFRSHYQVCESERKLLFPLLTS